MDMHGETYRPESLPTKKYGQLSESEKAAWHADTYAWRIIHGHATLAEIVGGKYSPTDPEGEWWRRVQGVVRQRVLLAEQERERANRRRDIGKDDLAAQGREFLNKWAVRSGYVNWDAAWDANMRPGMPPGFLQRVAAEVREMFPSKYMRISGGDLPAKVTGRGQPEQPVRHEPVGTREDDRPANAEPEAEEVMF